MKKHILLKEELHIRLDIFRAKNKLRSFNEAVEKLLNAYDENKGEIRLLKDQQLIESEKSQIRHYKQR